MAVNQKPNYQQYKRYYQTIEPLISKPKNRAYTTTIFSFLAISLFGWYGIRPTLQTILFLRREIADNTVVNKIMEEKITNLIEAQANYQAIEDQLPLIDQAVPETPDALTLVFQLKNLAEQTQVTVSSISIPSIPLLGQEATPSSQKTQNQPKEKIVPMVVSVNGPYSNIKAFLEGVINMRRIVTVNSSIISSLKDEEVSDDPLAPKSLRLVIRLQGYYSLKGKTQ